MFCHRFTKLKEIWHGDRSGKLNEIVTSLNFMGQPCNSAIAMKIEGDFPYDGICRK